MVGEEMLLAVDGAGWCCPCGACDAEEGWEELVVEWVVGVVGW